MKYKIQRVSTYNESKPCPEAFVIKVKYGNFDTEWDEWAVEINTLEELQAFVKKHGSIILDDDEIIIYDDYIE